MQIIWNGNLVVLSILIAILGSFAALSHAERMRESTGRAAKVWMVAGGVTLGIAVWSMHFIGMLAFHLPIPIGYDTFLTFVSILPAVAAALLGFYLLQSATMQLRRIAIGGFLMGIGITTMHYTGMAALKMQPAIDYDPLIFGLSLFIAIAASIGALLIVYFSEKSSLPRLVWHSLGALIMADAIAGMHYTAMAGAAFAPGSICTASGSRIEPTLLAFIIAAAVFVLVSGGWIANLIDRRFTQQRVKSVITQKQMILLEACIERSNDIVMITEAEPFHEPGPKIVFVNDAFEKRTGFSREEIIGKTPRMLQGTKTQRSELDRIGAALKKWQPIRAELINYTKSGAEFWLELDIVPIADSIGWYTHWIAIGRDITQRKQAELDLSRLGRALELRNALSQAIIHSADEPALLNQACQFAIDIGGYCSAWVGYKQDDASKTIDPVAVVGPAFEHIKGNKISWSEDVTEGLGPVGRSIRSGTAFVCEDFTQANFFRSWLASAQKSGLTGAVYLPLRDQQNTFGIFVLYLNEVRTIAAQEIALLQALVDDLVFGIMSLRAQQKQRRVQSAILKITTSVSAHFFEQLASNMAEAVGADGVFIARLLPGQPVIARTIVGITDGEQVANFEYLVSDTPCKRLLLDGECVISNHLTESFPNSISLNLFGAQAYVGRGLLGTSGQPLGFMYLLFRKPLEKTDFILATLKIFATRAAAELERLAADARMREQASLLDKARDAIIVRSLDHRILYWNKSAERLYGWTAAEAMQTQMDELIYQNPADLYQTVSIVLKNREWVGEFNQRKKDGTLLTVEGHWTLVDDEQGNPQSILAINTDITTRKVAQEEIQQLAFYDSLTKLPNRQLLLDRLKLVMANSSRDNRIGMLMFIDLDHFKTLNDSLGHDVGDLLLKEVATRLMRCVRAGDTVARFGGDEFVVLMAELSQEIDAAVNQAKKVAEKIFGTLNEPYHLAGHTHSSSPSIGITLINQQSHNVEELLKQADLAMYQAKAAGRNTLRFYDTEMQNTINIKVALENDIRHALTNKEFLLYYQPQIDNHRQIIGAEALIRWRHPTRGIVLPGHFIPLAEETRLILSLGRWVLEAACNQLVAWEKQPETAELLLAVNVSVYQFRQPDFVQQVLQILEKTGANPFRLKLELTESLLANNLEDIIEKMTLLKTKGVGFALDDFGTGYSSLSYLKQLPLDQLKIDQSFVRDILTDPNDAAIARAVVTLAQSLGLEVIAEGVETEEQREFLLQNNCYIYQGYLFSQPMPIDKFEVYIRNNSSNLTAQTD